MKRISNILLVCLTCSILVSSAAAQRRRGRAQAKPVDVQGAYTNMEYTESGDIGGATVIIIMANSDYYFLRRSCKRDEFASAPRR